MTLIKIMLNTLFLMLSKEMVKSTTSNTVYYQKLAVAIENSSSSTGLIDQTSKATDGSNLTVFPTFSSAIFFSSEALENSSSTTNLIDQTSKAADAISLTVFPTFSSAIYFSSEVMENSSSTTGLIDQTSKATDGSNLTVFPTFSSAIYFSSEALENSSSTTNLINQTSKATDGSNLTVFPTFSSAIYFSSEALENSSSTTGLIDQISKAADGISLAVFPTFSSAIYFSSEAIENSSSLTSLIDHSSKISDASNLTVFPTYSSASYSSNEAKTLSSVFTGVLNNSFISLNTNIDSSTQAEQLLHTATTALRQSDLFSANENAYSSYFQTAGNTYGSLNSKTLLHSSIFLVYSSSISSFSVFSTRIPVSVEIIYEFRIAIKMEFNDFLKNPSSNDFIKLQNVVVQELTAIFRKIEGFIKVVVIGFEKGSVRINSRVFFDKNEAKASDSVLQGKVINNFMQHLNSSNGTVGGFLVDAKSVSIERTLDVRSSSVANWIIVMIVALILLLALSVVILLQRRKIRDFKDRLYVSEHISAGSFSRYDKPNFELVQVRKISTKDMKKESEILKNNNEHETISKSLFYGDINGVNVENKKPSDKDGSVSKKYINGAYISDD